MYRKKIADYLISIGSLRSRATPEPSADDAENIVEVIKEIPFGDTLFRAAVRKLIDSGGHPLIQPDLLDAHTLLRVLQSDGSFPHVTPWRLALELKGRYFRSLGPVQCDGLRVHLWTALPSQPIVNIKAILRKRMAALVSRNPEDY